MRRPAVLRRVHWTRSRRRSAALAHSAIEPSAALRGTGAPAGAQTAARLRRPRPLPRPPAARAPAPPRGARPPCARTPGEAPHTRALDTPDAFARPCAIFSSARPAWSLPTGTLPCNPVRWGQTRPTRLRNFHKAQYSCLGPARHGATGVASTPAGAHPVGCRGRPQRRRPGRRPPPAAAALPPRSGPSSAPGQQAASGRSFKGAQTRPACPSETAGPREHQQPAQPR